MTKSPLFLAAGIAGLALALTFAPARFTAHAQSRSSFLVAAQQGGHIALGLALRKLGVSGTLVQTPAHPDDEHNALHALTAHGMGLRSITLQATRGEGGQNEIGPELFRDMGVLRTSELLAAHRIDGAEQYFTRAIDYGYSFDPQEVVNKWGREQVVGDFVRLIRKLRPDVMLTMNIQGRGGDRAHEATTIVTREAYEAAGDPAKYPEQIREGLWPWRPKKLYFSANFGGPPGGRGGPGGPGAGPGAGPGRGRGGDRKGPPPAPQTPAGPPPKLARPNTAAYDSLLGRTYAEIGSEARSNHKCQGMGGLPPLPGSTGGRGGAGGYQLMDTAIEGQKGKDETSLFEGIDTRIEALAQYAGPNPPEPLTAGLAAIGNAARRAQQAFEAGKDTEVASAVGSGLAALRDLRAKIGSLGLNDGARYEIDFRLEQKERDYQDALLAAHGLALEAVADDGVVIPGQPVKVSVLAVNRGTSEVRIGAVGIAGFESAGGCDAAVLKKDGVFNCSVEMRVPKNAALTTPYFNDRYWKNPERHAFNEYESNVAFGIPFQPSPFEVMFTINVDDRAVSKQLPVQFRYMYDTYTGDKRMELNVVPAFSVRVSPGLAVIPESAKPVSREVHVSVTTGAKGKAQGDVTLELPAGWKATPASVSLRFMHEDESLSARFQISAPPNAKAGEYTLRAAVTSGGQKFTTGYQVIEYPHVQRRHVIKAAEATVKVIDVKTAANLRVGYVIGVGDQVPAALEQLGVKVDYIDPDELAWGDLSKHDVIITGVRAYERRLDLRAYNRRLLDYVEHGGIVIVQYNKMEFNQADYGPFPAKVSGNRVSDETVPVKVLEPAHPAFNYPNKIGPSAWAGWVQERGLYFLGEKDKKYSDLVSMVDSYKDNPGEKRGAFVEGKLGKGRWIYLGLGLWRQLPAGTSGAYQLLANLISLPKAPATAAAR